MCNCVPSSLIRTFYYSGIRTHKLVITSTSDYYSLQRIDYRNFVVKRSSVLQTLSTKNTSLQLHNRRLRLNPKVSKSDNYEQQLYDDLNEELEKEIRASELDPISSKSFDFLELKSDLVVDENKEITKTLLDNEEEKNDLKEEDDVVGKRELSKGRKFIRRSNILAKQVISIQSALSLGFVSQIWVDTSSWVVSVVEVRPSMLSGEMERFFLEDVCQVGDVVLVEDEGVLEEDIRMFGLDILVGYNVVTPSRRSIGKVRGFTFNINSGAVELLELDSFGISIIPASLVTTYALFVEDVIDVESDTVVVHEAAASRVQRLTKGLWDTPNTESSREQREEYPDLERRNSRRNRQKFTSSLSESEDDLQLPMDYM
ncbi:hypothetical protein FRX31_030893 [Thalictrum thalictroides]|uniref:PRC-barrel domain-containing protein n=1 Tax=Thalictrum thalictroides TaxID=46969 RepID=A0A7J6V3A5_THATH|nr:hypothetical protein FRX31_030893 [Thalictrum thalictroides]